MTSDKPDKKAEAAAPNAQRKRPRPEWTVGLRQLYDSVVEEPIPDSFKDLLSRLDSKD